jgi:hypothetical protein
VPAKIPGKEKMAAGFRANTTNPLKIRKVQVTVLWTVLWINTAKLPPIFPSTPPLDIGDRSSLPD